MEIRGKKIPAPCNSKPKVSQIWRAWKLHRILECSYMTILATPFLVALFQGKGSFGCKGRSCLLLPNLPTGSTLLLLKEATVWCWSLVASLALTLLWLHQLPVQKFRQFNSAPKKPTFSFNYQGSRATRNGWKPIDRRKTHVQQNPEFPIKEEKETQSTIPYVWFCTSQDTQRWSEMVISEREICEMMVWERGRERIFAYNSRDASIRSWQFVEIIDILQISLNSQARIEAATAVIGFIIQPVKWWWLDWRNQSVTEAGENLHLFGTEVVMQRWIPCAQWWMACSELLALLWTPAVLLLLLLSLGRRIMLKSIARRSHVWNFCFLQRWIWETSKSNLAKTRNLETTQTKKAWLKQS